MDSKHSGQSEQLIQYNNRTHQIKYGSPGIFPVVHLLKKNIPVRSISPNKITKHLNIQELPAYYDVECCDAVEDLTHHDNCETCYENQEANINTHNLLDALTEISRKRIHSESEDLHTHSYKQQRCAAADSGTNLRDSEIHVTEVPPVINAITASLSSARTYIVYPRRSIIKKNYCTEAGKKEHKHAITQTDNRLSKSNKPSSKTLNNKLQHKKLVKTGSVCKKTTSAVITKLFDETQFEVAKKNKLSVLLSPLTGNQVKPLKSFQTDDGNKLFQSQIKPASIISPKNKPKHNKHVTFAIPEKGNTETVSTDSLKIDSHTDSVLDDYKNKTHYDAHFPLTPQFPNNEEKASDGHLTSENNSENESPPSIVHSSSEIPFSNESKAPLIITDKFANDHVTTTQITSTVGSIASSITLSSVKVGGFKFDLKNDSLQNTGTEALIKNNDNLQNVRSEPLLPSGSEISVKPQFLPVNFNTSNNNPQIRSSSLTNMPMFSSSSPTPFSQVVDTFFSNEGVVKPKSYIDTILDTKKSVSAHNSITNANFSSSSSPFGANTTVTSVGRSMLLSTGLGTSAIVTTTGLTIPPATSTVYLNSTSSLSPPKINFDTNQTQPFGSTFGINTIKSSGFGSSDFLNTTSKQVINFSTNPTAGYSASTTNVCTNTTSNNAGTGLTSVIFGSTPFNKGREELLPTTTTGFSFGNSFDSSVFTNDRFKQNSNGPTSGFGDNISFTQSAVKSNSFNTAVSNENSIFGARNNNSIAGNFTGLESTAPQGNSLFTSSPSIGPPQSEKFTVGISNVVSLPSTDMFSRGIQNDVGNTEKFNLLDTSNVSPLFSTVPNSTFGSIVTSLQPSTNSFCFSTNTGFNTLTYNNAASPNFDSTTSRIFSIGSSTSYSKSRTQLKGRRRT